MGSEPSGSKPVTLINVFTVAPENQQKLVELLTQSAQTLIPHAPGFRSSRLYRSLDGTKVTVYSQWRSLRDYQAVRESAATVPFLEQALAIAQFEPVIYEVVETFIGPQTPA
jgi:heme-degrading monooxygenase HmoA